MIFECIATVPSFYDGIDKGHVFLRVEGNDRRICAKLLHECAKHYGRYNLAIRCDGIIAAEYKISSKYSTQGDKWHHYSVTSIDYTQAGNA